MFTTGTMPPTTIGNWARLLLARSSLASGLSVAPKSTVPALTCADAAARADRLVIDLGAALALVVRRPGGQDRIDEGRAGAGDLRARTGGATGLIAAVSAARGDERERGEREDKLVHGDRTPVCFRICSHRS